MDSHGCYFQRGTFSFPARNSFLFQFRLEALPTTVWVCWKFIGFCQVLVDLGTSAEFKWTADIPNLEHRLSSIDTRFDSISRELVSKSRMPSNLWHESAERAFVGDASEKLIYGPILSFLKIFKLDMNEKMWMGEMCARAINNWKSLSRVKGALLRPPTGFHIRPRQNFSRSRGTWHANSFAPTTQKLLAIVWLWEFLWSRIFLHCTIFCFHTAEPQLARYWSTEREEKKMFNALHRMLRNCRAEVTQWWTN